MARGYRHFLYGGKPGVAEELAAELSRRFPGLKIVGTYTPPFRTLTRGRKTTFAPSCKRLRPMYYGAASAPRNRNGSWLPIATACR